MRRMTKQATFTARAGDVFDTVEAHIAQAKADYPAFKAALVDDVTVVHSRNSDADRRYAARQIARNMADLIAEAERALNEAREIQARTPQVADLPVTLPTHKPPTGWVYFAVRHADKAIKIGYSKNPSERVKGFSAGSGPCTLVAEKPGRIDDETELHRRFKASCVGGEWFTATPELLGLIRKWPLL